MRQRHIVRLGVIGLLTVQTLDIANYTIGLLVDQEHDVHAMPAWGGPWSPHHHVPPPDLDNSTTIMNTVGSLTASAGVTR